MNKFYSSVDLTDDVGATVCVSEFSEDRVSLLMGGDLSISISFKPEVARHLADALVLAADSADSADSAGG